MADSQLSGGMLGRGLLWALLIAGLVLIVSLYVEEDMRGASELVAAKARWKAAGYSLNPTDYYPPPVPNDQNLAALPVFELEPNPMWSGQLWAKRLSDSTSESQHGGDLTDYEHKLNLATLVVKAYAKKFPGKKPPASPLAQFEELYPLISDLRTAAATRPIFRINLDYAVTPAWNRPLGPITSQIAVARLLSYDAKLALAEKQPQVAMDDYNLAFELARGTGTDPSLVGGLVTLGICAITRAPIDDELSKHTWNDAQLARIQDQMKRIDCLAIYQFDMRSEVAAHTLPMYQWIKEQPSAVDLILGMAGGGTSKPKDSFVGWFFSQLWANGWWDMNAAQSVDFMLDAAHGADLATRRVDPKVPAELEARVEKTKEYPAPWNILYAVASGPMASSMKKFAQGQVQLDEDRIVCGLERYRLAQGTYPPKLDALAPKYIDELPHDIINGTSYHYRLNPDGTFVLYSVGWNQVDDGGTVALKTGYAKPAIDFDNGDWVWPMVPK